MIKKFKFKKRLVITLTSIFFVFFFIFLYLELIVNPMIVDISEAEVDSLATTVISDSIYEVVNEYNLVYDDILDIKYDKEGNVSSMTANMEKVNFLAREISTVSQIKLDELRNRGVDVAIGAFTGMPVFNEVGPRITLRLMPIGSIITSFDSQFVSTGINQTKHSIYVDVNASVTIILPTSTKKISFITQTLICENIIVGKVPEFFFENGGRVVI